MSETTTSAVETEGAAEEPKLTGKDLIREETSSEGRYIPYSGGSLGWFENSGILKVERSNDYKFFTAIDSAKVRQKLFERWGNDVNRRMEERVDLQKPTPVKITWDGHSHDADTKDLSAHGLRLQLLEETQLKIGDKIEVHVLRRVEDKEEMLSIDSKVMWVARVGKRRLVWNIGIGFTNIDEDTERKLREYLLQ
jgi:c-di-GMP-binding flagellar brake protein YcgR